MMDLFNNFSIKAGLKPENSSCLSRAISSGDISESFILFSASMRCFSDASKKLAFPSIGPAVADKGCDPGDKSSSFFRIDGRSTGAFDLSDLNLDVVIRSLWDGKPVAVFFSDGACGGSDPLTGLSLISPTNVKAADAAGGATSASRPWLLSCWSRSMSNRSPRSEAIALNAAYSAFWTAVNS